jgi:3-carboxy-cis,cis-muconate cycloisomerase
MSFSALDSGLLGPLFATDEMRDCFSDAAVLRAMVEMEAALARAQARLGLVPAGLAAAIEAAGAELDIAALGRDTAHAGVPSIPFVKAVQARLPAELAAAFHKGATTQDLIDTALILRLRPALGLVEEALDAIMAGLMRQAEDFRDTPCVGRTYGQHAAPLTFGFKAAVWLTGIAEVADGLPALRKRLLVASLGGPVGTLAALGADGPAVLEGFASELDLGATPLAWHALRGRIAEAGAFLCRLVGALAKMAADVASLASTDIGEVAEPHLPGRGGSSAMPHKRNPVASTVILAAHAACPGFATTLFGAMAVLHERPPGLWHAEWQALPPLFGLASGALREARTLAEGLAVDAPRMRSNIDTTHGLLFADAAAARLTPVLGREAAHARVARAADEVRLSGVHLRDVLARDFPACDFGSVFELGSSILAAGPWVDRALSFAAEVRSKRFFFEKKNQKTFTSLG